MKDREKEVEKNLSSIEGYKKNIDDTIIIKQKTNTEESSNIKQLYQLSNKYGYVIDLYRGIPKENIDSFSQSEFDTILDPLFKLTVTGATAATIFAQTQTNFQNSTDQSKAISMTDGTTDNSLKSIEIIANSDPRYFPSFTTSKATFKTRDSLDEDIEYLKLELPKLLPDISKDFEAYINKYYAFKLDESKYQDLIGARSMFFLKLIFENIDNNYGSQTTGGKVDRKKYIAKFVFGNAVYQPIADPQIAYAKQIYSNLSGQSGTSAKQGNLSLNDIEIQFRDMITSFANIIRLRNIYFQP